MKGCYSLIYVIFLALSIYIKANNDYNVWNMNIKHTIDLYEDFHIAYKIT